jgi:hypothetical protein
MIKAEYDNRRTAMFKKSVSFQFIALCETHIYPLLLKTSKSFPPSKTTQRESLSLLRRQNVKSVGNLLLPRQTILAVDLSSGLEVLASLCQQTCAQDNLVFA